MSEWSAYVIQRLRPKVNYRHWNVLLHLHTSVLKCNYCRNMSSQKPSMRISRRCHMHMNMFFAEKYIPEQESTCDVSSRRFLEFGFFQHCIHLQTQKSICQSSHFSDCYLTETRRITHNVMNVSGTIATRRKYCLTLFVQFICKTTAINKLQTYIKIIWSFTTATCSGMSVPSPSSSYQSKFAIYSFIRHLY
jgi:hypothetical protein